MEDKYNYPPLLCDLLKYIPSWDCEIFDDEKMEELGENCELNPVAQLAYVLPHTSLNLLPSNVADYVVKIKFVVKITTLSGHFADTFGRAMLYLTE